MSDPGISDYENNFIDEVQQRVGRWESFESPKAREAMRKAEIVLLGYDPDPEEDVTLTPEEEKAFHDRLRFRQYIADALRAMLLANDAWQAEAAHHEDALKKLSGDWGRKGGVERREKVEHYWDDMVAWAQEELDRQTHATSGAVWRAIAERLTKKYGSKDDPPEDLLRTTDTIRNRVKQDAPALYAQIIAFNSGKRKR